MKKFYFILFLFFLFIGCNKNKTNADNQITIKIESYLKNSLDGRFSYEQQSEYNKNAFELLSNLENTSYKRKKLDLVIDNYFYLNQWSDYIKASKKLLTLSDTAKDTVYIAKSLRYQGNYYYREKILDSAFYFYYKSEKYFKKLKDYNSYSIVLLKKGIVQLELNDFFGADVSLTKAYNILKKTDDNQRIYATLNSLGTVSSELSEYDRAIANYKKALDIVKKAKLETREHQSANCYNNIGLVYLELKNYKNSILYFNKALKDENLKKDNPLLYSSVIDNLAYSKLKNNNYKNLQELFFESLKIRDSLNYSNYKVLTYIHLSEYFYKTNDFIKAKEYSIKAIETANISKLPYYSIASLKQAATVDEENSSKYSDDYIRISDSLQIAERKSKDRFARIQLETDEIRQERDDFEEKSQYNLYYLFGTISFFIILIAIRTQRSRNRVIALKQAQQKANEDIYKLIISQQGKLQEGRELEKARIARELHDGVLGRLFGLRLNLDGLNDSNEEAAIAMRLNYINELKLIEQDIREISHELSREKLVLINNFVSIINNLIDEQSKVHKADIKLKVQNTIDWDKLSNIIKINLYRILQESLQNINKHAEAKNVKINFNMDRKNNLVLKVVDDGKGFHVDKNKPGIGIKNILGRVNDCKGVLDIKSEIGKGTKIIITVPFENNTQLN